MRRLVTYILILVIVGAGGYYAYTAFFAPQKSLPPPGTIKPIEQNNPFPVAGQRTVSTTSTAIAISSSSSPLPVVSPTQRLVHLTSEPISGFWPITTSGNYVVRYNERSSGHIFDVATSTKAFMWVSNTTLPNIYESLWMSPGDRGIIRYAKSGTNDIESYFFKLNTANPQGLSMADSQSAISYGYYLPEQITTLAVAPMSNKVFFLTNTPDGSSGIVENIDTQKKSTIFSSPFREWTASWPSKDIITLTTKPAHGVAGYLYFLNPQTGAIKSILSGVNGLTTLTNPSGAFVLVGDDLLNLYILNIKTGTSTATGLKGLPEKCVWSQKNKNLIYCALAAFEVPKATYPDDWYQGLVSFSDELYTIDAGVGTAVLTSNFHSIINKDLDIIHPQLSQDESYISFIDKHDNTLWFYSLTSSAGTAASSSEQ